jgi:hypothetical protein
MDTACNLPSSAQTAAGRIDLAANLFHFAPLNSPVVWWTDSLFMHPGG